MNQLDAGRGHLLNFLVGRYASFHVFVASRKIAYSSAKDQCGKYLKLWFVL